VTRIGLISDTHGLLRPEALAYLRGADLIVHAGDIGKPEILEQLAAIAPVTAVRGNNDRGPWAEGLRESRTVEAGGIRVLVIHDVAQLDAGMRKDSVRVVVAGHSHRAAVKERDGILYVNPGSAGPRRFRLPVTAGELLIDARGKVTANTADLL